MFFKGIIVPIPMMESCAIGTISWLEFLHGSVHPLQLLVWASPRVTGLHTLSQMNKTFLYDHPLLIVINIGSIFTSIWYGIFNYRTGWFGFEAITSLRWPGRMSACDGRWPLKLCLGARRSAPGTVWDPGSGVMLSLWSQAVECGRIHGKTLWEIWLYTIVSWFDKPT